MNLRKQAQGRPCQIMSNVCNRNPETTVLAHLNNKRLFKCGMGQKVDDWAGSWSCSACHDLVDFRVKSDVYTDDEIKLMHMEGVFRTLQILFDEGVL